MAILQPKVPLRPSHRKHEPRLPPDASPQRNDSFQGNITSAGLSQPPAPGDTMKPRAVTSSSPPAAPHTLSREAGKCSSTESTFSTATPSAPCKQKPTFQKCLSSVPLESHTQGRKKKKKKDEEGEGRTWICETLAGTAFAPRTFAAPPLPCIRRSRRPAARHPSAPHSSIARSRHRKAACFPQTAPEPLGYLQRVRPRRLRASK